MSKETHIVTVPHGDEALKAPKVVDKWTNRINNELNENLACLHPDDAKEIVARLHASRLDTQGRHIFCEVVLGRQLQRSGYGPRYEQPIEGYTPDWTLTVHPHRAIIEVVNVDPSAEVSKQLLSGRAHFTGDRSDKLYNAIRGKAMKYREVTDRHATPFVVAVYPSFGASLDDRDLADALQNEDYGIFLDAEHLSGVLVFESLCFGNERSYAEHWHYRYCANPHATNVWHHLP